MSNRIYTLIGAGLFALAPVLSGCSEIEDGKNTIDSWTKVESYIPEGGLQHPCLLLTQEEIDAVKTKLEAGAEPQTRTFAHMTRAANPYTSRSYSPTPVKKLARLDPTNWGPIDRWESLGIADDWYQGIHGNYMNFDHDCAAAYAQAVLWKLTGEEIYAMNAVKILNAWARTCVGYVTNKQNELIDPNQKLIALTVYQFSNAAELMRDYSGWSSGDFTKFKNWMVDVFYTRSTEFLSSHGSAKCPLHEWLNWDLANMNVILSIGILCDDNFKINEAIQYFKSGAGSGMIANAIPFTHQDPDSNEMLGQCQEIGRDQGHSALCTAMMSIFCKMAGNVGEDLFAYANYLPLSMFEYYAKHNVGTSEERVGGKSWRQRNYRYNNTPYTLYEKCTSTLDNKQWPEISYEEHQNGSDSRGATNPAWELICKMARDHNQSAIYSNMFREQMLLNAERGYCDGGAGDYGPDSGGFDVFGWGSLLYAE